MSLVGAGIVRISFVVILLTSNQKLNAAFTLSGFDHQKRNPMCVKTDFQV